MVYTFLNSEGRIGKGVRPGPFWLALRDRDFQGYGSAFTYAVEKRRDTPGFSLEQATLDVVEDFKPDYIIYEENDLPSNLPIKAALREFLTSSSSTREAIITGGWHYGEIELWKIRD